MITHQIHLTIVDKESDSNQQCLILYHGDKIALEVQGGKIDADLELANVYFDWGFTLETLNDCLSKICTVLKGNCPNVTNTKPYAYNLTFGSKSAIIEANAIIEYDIVS
ncbi:MAG: hypothetical protein IKB97_06470 [Bacteroidaceae bacterium]|nr:hypothetical protein [Bacteroidaceae bacterium]